MTVASPPADRGSSPLTVLPFPWLPFREPLSPSRPAATSSSVAQPSPATVTLQGGGQGGGLVRPHGVPVARLCPRVTPLPSGLGPVCSRGFRLPLGGFRISFACVLSGPFPGTSKPPSSLLVSRRAPPAGSWLSAILVPPFSHLPHSNSGQSLLAAFSCACTATSRHAFLTQARGHPTST